MNVGIYKIENIVNGHCYIGQSVNLRKREHDHFHELEKNNHRNIYLQRAYKKYGKENIVFSALLYCEKSELTRYEQLFVDTFTPEYNICRECVDSSKGIKHTEEARHNMSLAHIGKKQSKEAIRKTALANIGNTYSLGYKHTEETKKKMSLASTGRPSCWKGKKLSEETRQKMSLSQKARFEHKREEKE